MAGNIYQITSSFPENEIDELWNDNKQVHRIAYVGGSYLLVADRNYTYGGQKWATREEFPSDYIMEGWKQKYFITSIGHDGDFWFVVMSLDCGFTDQKWFTSASFPKKEIQKNLDKGFVITDLGYFKDRWVVIFSKYNKYKDQIFDYYKNVPKDIIKKNWDRGYFITTIAPDYNGWAVVMSKAEDFELQFYSWDTKFPQTDVDEKFLEGYEILDIKTCDNQWVALMTIFNKEESASSEDVDNAEDDPGLNEDENDPFKDISQTALDYFIYGNEYFDKKDYKKAINYYEKAIKECPKFSKALNAIGAAYSWLYDDGKALKYYKEAFNYDKNDPIIVSNIISIMDQKGMTDEMITMLSEVPEKLLDKIEDGKMLYYAGKAFDKKGLYKDAIKYYKISLKIDQNQEIVKDSLKEAEKKLKTAPEIKEEIVNKTTDIPDNKESLDEVLKELNNLVGLTEFKKEVENLIASLQMRKERLKRGLSVTKLTLHSVFTGPPGTGKTTVSRLVGKLFKAMGLLKKGHVVEVSRADIVAEHIGGTAPKTLAAIESALDGVLFVDEAYSLMPKDSGNDFGREAVEIILKKMEDYKDRLVVILAGYTNEMTDLINSNPGLKSRFTNFYNLPDYKPEELLEIFKRIAAKKEILVEEDAIAKLGRYFTYVYNARTKSFGNARAVENLFQEISKYQDSRLLKKKQYTDADLLTFTLEDINAAIDDEFVEELPESIDDILKDLNEMIGMEKVKKDISDLLGLIKGEKILKEKGIKSEPITLHSVLFGPPGTGKTSVARKLGKIFKSLGLLPTSNVIEATRADLVAEYIGQTASKTQKVLERAMHGVLFIDEAYMLVPENSAEDFGQEAVDTIMKRMDDDRDKFVVVIAGYTDEMQRLINSNPGIKSRFNRYFYFDDYTPEQLFRIFEKFCKDNSRTLSKEAEIKLKEFIRIAYENRDKTFGNGRFMRNIFEKIRVVHAARIARDKNIPENQITTFQLCDVEMVISEQSANELNKKEKNKFGF